MKAKLTLTIKKSVIDAAKRRAKNKGISLSRMFLNDIGFCEINFQ
ncbi:DUF6364 family protein [Aquiflexum lacus]